MGRCVTGLPGEAGKGVHLTLRSVSGTREGLNRCCPRCCVSFPSCLCVCAESQVYKIEWNLLSDHGTTSTFV